MQCAVQEGARSCGLEASSADGCERLARASACEEYPRASFGSCSEGHSKWLLSLLSSEGTVDRAG